MSIFTWLLSRVEEKQDSELESKTLLDIYELETITSGSPVNERKRALIEHLPNVFPNVQRVRKSQRSPKGFTKVTFYRGITIKPPTLDEPLISDNLFDIKKFLTDDFYVSDEKDQCLTCKTKTDFVINQKSVCKMVNFYSSGKWTLSVNGKEINLENLYVDDKFVITKNCIELICKIVKSLKLCLGKQITKNLLVTRFQTFEQIHKVSGKNERIVRSILCEQLLSMTAKGTCCIKCLKMTLPTGFDNTKENIKPDEIDFTKQNENPKLSKSVLTELIPDLTDEMAELMLSQAKNAGRDPHGRRWSQKMIGICLQWYCKSPQSYEAFRSTKQMLLPSPSTLILYKNKVKHDIGFNTAILTWMHSEARRKNIHVDGWKGGIIIDEMSIQADLQISQNGDVVELCGFADAGNEGNACTVLRTGKNEKVIGTYALQFVFLGLTGFRFPFAHFITNGVQATELYGLFWEAVDKLQMFGFTVMYTSLDGAQSNRNFMKYNLGENSTSFKCSVPCNFNEMIFIMDVSHVIKKLRNNILVSGIGGKAKHHTRLLQLPTGDTVQWQMFYDCFVWDQANSLQLHRKLSKDHVILNTHLKMRNHLAEEILNGEMLNTMIQYQLSLGEKGQDLNGAIALLKNTSVIIDTFRDMRPVKHLNDTRLSELLDVSHWFKIWKEHTDEINSKEKQKIPVFLSYQCYEDLQSCLLGFIDLCRMVIQSSKEIFVTPALTNSDVVENLFNQQRSTYNGANSNPNALQYKKSLNSIILGQTLVSRKANAGRGRDAAIPYAYSMKTYQTKKRKLSDISNEQYKQ